MMDDRAVSEAIGFILILGLVLTGIGLVTLYGYPVLAKEQSSTDMKNMERAMIVIQNDMKSLCYKNVPYKESTLQVSGGTLEVIDADDYGSSMNISYNTGSDTGYLVYPLGALTYRSDRSNEVITLENGAVITRQDGQAGSAMLAEPRWFYDEPTKTFVIYIMNVIADDRMAKSGMATVRMSLEKASTRPHEPEPPGGPVTVTVTYTADTKNDHSTAWKNYLTGPTVGMERKGGAENTYEISGVSKLVIKEYNIKILGI
ncbi:MAG: hypothetical protein GX216_11135 [Methanomicrobiales archaeon]|mgnify:CR=1 FL=1|nr:hypothetical protein [Methanomicrobiales archaeon]